MEGNTSMAIGRLACYKICEGHSGEAYSITTYINMLTEGGIFVIFYMMSYYVKKC